MKPFVEFPKIPRLHRGMIITEKIDGTNASIFIPEIPGEAGDKPFLVGSRNRWITPEADNFGFARWAYSHTEELLQLGPGHHFGEWWGLGIQRGYGMKEKHFSLFNTSRWGLLANGEQAPRPACVDVAPVLYTGPFDSTVIEQELKVLEAAGSKAAPGFMKPEGVVIYLVASRSLYKVTIEKDSEPKSRSRVAVMSFPFPCPA